LRKAANLALDSFDMGRPAKEFAKGRILYLGFHVSSMDCSNRSTFSLVTPGIKIELV
jgi:hypothetical protein